MSTTKRQQQCLSVIASYPSLLSHEESMVRSPFDVMGWFQYLLDIDDLLEELEEHKKSVAHKKKSTVLTVGGGRVLRISSSTTGVPLIQTCLAELRKTRAWVGDRCVALLPGSYKLAKLHLGYLRKQLLLSAAAVSHHHHHHHPDSSYCLHSSTRHRRYNRVVAAYEACLVRLHKMPRLWLDYLEMVTTHRPQDVTATRRLFDRALVALPVTQHEKIWKPYVAYLMRGLNKKNKNDDDKDKGLSPIIMDVDIPAETILRVLRRRVLLDPTTREMLADTCIRLNRNGEAALTLVDLLNSQNTPSSSSTTTSTSTRHDLWMKLAQVATHHPEEMHRVGLDFEAILRAALPKSKAQKQQQQSVRFVTFDKTSENVVGDSSTTAARGDDTTTKENDDNAEEEQRRMQQSLGEMEGTLWTKLADSQIRLGEFELARSTYEEALESVSRVRDFSLIFDAYMKFEEGVIEAMMELMDDDEEEEEEEDEGDSSKQNSSSSNNNDDNKDWDILLNQGDVADMDLALARAEYLTFRRPLLLNRVLLRQNPHNVGEWLKRSQLYLQNKDEQQDEQQHNNYYSPPMAAAALEEAVKAVHARRAINGAPCELYITLASIYEKEIKDVDKARQVFRRVCQDHEYKFAEVDDLAQCHAAWVELELRHEAWDEALSVARQSVAPFSMAAVTEGEEDEDESAATDAANKRSVADSKVIRGLTKSLRLWNLLLDMEESLGTVQTAKDAYSRALETRVATPMHVLNYASFLKDQKYFEESFTAYERGVELFAFPHAGAKLLWKTYLSAFLKRYEGTKTPRVRELFEQCLQGCPPEDSSEFFLMYGDYEEKYGLTKRALGVYERMCITVPPAEKYTAYQLYIAKTVQYLGMTATRPIYERAIAALEDSFAAKICLDFATMETSLHEIDRARTVYTYGSQMADPRRSPQYWKEWHEFEVAHGNEETFREMLRVKRGVQAAFSTVNYNAAEMGGGEAGGTGDAAAAAPLSDQEAIRMLAEQEGDFSIDDTQTQKALGGFVASTSTTSTKKRTAEAAGLEEMERRAARLRQAAAAAAASEAKVADNDAKDEEIDIDEEEDEEEVEPSPSPAATKKSDAVLGISTKAVPAAVFGGLAPSGSTEEKKQ